MAFFSFGYTRLSAGTGALVLIGGVQLTMLYVAWREGERFSLLSWLGLGLALIGVIYLVLPGVSAPDPLGSVLMAISGASFGLFSLLARRGSDPVEVNASNLLWCLPPLALVNLCLLGDFTGTPAGFALAIASGALATGFGYIVWYLAVRNLTAGQAATVQLSMPAVTALGGVIFLAEPLSLRLLIASAAMIGGIAVVMVQRSKPAHHAPNDRDRAAAGRALVLGAAGDVEHGVADHAGQHAADQGAGVAGRMDVAVVEHGVAPAADLARSGRPRPWPERRRSRRRRRPARGARRRRRWRPS